MTSKNNPVAVRYRAVREWLWYVNRRTQVRTGFYIWSPR